MTELKVDFGKLTVQNVEQFRVLNYMTLPIVYSEDFYNRLTNYSRYSSLAYYKDVLVGAISCKFEDGKDKEGNPDGTKVVYIMSITVLKPYRRYNIGSQLLDKAIEDCVNGEVSSIYLHVLCANESACKFYEKAGFVVKEKLENYYTDITPPDCFIFEKKL